MSDHANKEAFVDLGDGRKLPCNNEFDEQKIAMESINGGFLPPWTIGHGRARDEGRACPDRFCGCRYTFDGERVRRIAPEDDVR
jgi:hypothetical protein